MTLTYIFHSGFVLETEASILIFDYWMDRANVMSSVLSKNKPLYVFSSHFHEDHFTKEIFGWKRQRSNITYILSKNIKKIADSFDVVMFPIDGRVGNGYTLGGRQFIERFKVRLFVPFWKISKEGDIIDILKLNS